MKKTSIPRTPAALALDRHQAVMVELVADRLGGTRDDVLEFLVTVGLHTLQLDPAADGRVADGFGRFFGKSEIGEKILEALRDVNTENHFAMDGLLAELFRPRMTGDWRGEAKPATAEA